MKTGTDNFPRDSLHNRVCPLWDMYKWLFLVLNSVRVSLSKPQTSKWNGQFSLYHMPKYMSFVFYFLYVLTFSASPTQRVQSHSPTSMFNHPVLPACSIIQSHTAFSITQSQHIHSLSAPQHVNSPSPTQHVHSPSPTQHVYSPSPSQRSSILVWLKLVLRVDVAEMWACDV